MHKVHFCHVISHALAVHTPSTSGRPIYPLTAGPPVPAARFVFLNCLWSKTLISEIEKVYKCLGTTHKLS